MKDRWFLVVTRHLHPLLLGMFAHALLRLVAAHLAGDLGGVWVDTFVDVGTVEA